MKKLIFFLALITQFAFGQVNTSTVKAGKYQMNIPENGAKKDSAVVWDGISKLMKVLPISEIKGTTNLDILASPTGITIFSSTGNDAVLPLVTTTNAGLISPTDKIKLNGITSGATANQTDTYLLDRTNHVGTQAISTVSGLQTELNLKIPLSEKGATNGVATLGSDGKVPNSQIPALAISETFPVNSQAAMLGLSSAEQGDVAIRSDISKSFILRESPASILGNWSELLSPAIAVQSVNGQVGHVNLTTANINNSAGKRYQTDNQMLFNDATSSIQTQLNGKENSFTKNTAFNKNFGTTAGTVAEGNDSRILNGQTAFGWGNHAGLYPSLTGTGASGTWGINISGNATTATNIGWDGITDKPTTLAGYGISETNLLHRTGDETKDGSLSVTKLDPDYEELIAIKGITTGNGYGVKGESPEGVGVFGYSSYGQGVSGFSNYGQGVFGYSNSDVSVFGYSNSGVGVSGYSNSGVGALIKVGDSSIQPIAKFQKGGVDKVVIQNDGTISATQFSGDVIGNLTGTAMHATYWGGRPADLTAIQAEFDCVLTRGADEITRLTPLPQFKSWLGLGSNAYSSTDYLPLTGGTLSGSLTATSFIIPKGAMYQSSVGTNALTGNRTVSFPDASGTVALISQTVTNGVITSSPSQDAVYDFVTANAGTSGTSGTYTPTLTNGLNVTSTTFAPSVYTKIGNIVTVTVTIEAAVIAANSPASVTISLPFNRSTSDNAFVSGSGSAIEYSSNTYGSAFFKLQSNTTEVTLYFYPVTFGSYILTGTFSYSI